MWSSVPDGVAGCVTDSHDKLTTDPPRPPGTPDVDELVGDPVPAADRPQEGSDGSRGGKSDGDVPHGEDVDSDTVRVEPPD